MPPSEERGCSALHPYHPSPAGEASVWWARARNRVRWGKGEKRSLRAREENNAVTDDNEQG